MSKLACTPTARLGCSLPSLNPFLNSAFGDLCLGRNWSSLWLSLQTKVQAFSVLLSQISRTHLFLFYKISLHLSFVMVSLAIIFGVMLLGPFSVMLMIEESICVFNLKQLIGTLLLF